MGNTFKKKRKHPLQHLTQRCNELYKECKWEQSKIEQCIYESKFAPICPGLEDESPKRTECPICFLFFPQFALNATCCCDNKVCTECLLQILSPTTPSTCPFCNNQKLNFKLIVNAIKDPERYGLSESQFDAYVKQVKKNTESLKLQNESDGKSSSVVVATHKERLEHEAEMSKLNHQAELERHTSPTLSPFSSASGIGRLGLYSLDGGRQSNPSRQRRRRNSSSRSSRSSRNQAREQRELIQNTFGIHSELTNLLSHQNLDEILLAEAMRRSMSEKNPPPNVKKQEENQNKVKAEQTKLSSSQSSEVNNNNHNNKNKINNNNTSEDNMLAAAIALSLKEQSGTNNSTANNGGNDVNFGLGMLKGRATDNSESSSEEKESLKTPSSISTNEKCSNNNDNNNISKTPNVRSDDSMEATLPCEIKNSKQLEKSHENESSGDSNPSDGDTSEGKVNINAKPNYYPEDENKHSEIQSINNGTDNSNMDCTSNLNIVHVGVNIIEDGTEDAVKAELENIINIVVSSENVKHDANS
jgi:hypothetical protein